MVLFKIKVIYPNFLQVSMMWMYSLCSIWYLSICWYLQHCWNATVLEIHNIKAATLAQVQHCWRYNISCNSVTSETFLEVKFYVSIFMQRWHKCDIAGGKLYFICIAATVSLCNIAASTFNSYHSSNIARLLQRHKIQN